MTNTSLGDRGVLAICDFLRKNPIVHSIKLYQNEVGDEGARCFAELLKQTSSIFTLKLFSNQISDVGALSLGFALLKNTSLTTLSLGGNSIGPNGVQSLKEALLVNTSLTHLNVWDNKLGSEGTAVISSALPFNFSLQTLNLGGNQLDHLAISVLLQGLSQNSTLTTLKLYCNSLGDSGCSAVAPILHLNQSITTLKLYFNMISDSGACSLAPLLSSNVTLKTLNLGGNNISNEGTRSLAIALMSNMSLETLKLYSNHIESEGAKHLANLLRVNSTLTLLNIDDNAISDDGVAEITHSLLVNSTLRHLNLYNNRIQDLGASFIANALRSNSSLIEITLHQNQFSHRGLVELVESLSFNHSLQEFELLEGAEVVIEGEASLLREEIAFELETNRCLPQTIESFELQIVFNGNYLDLRNQNLTAKKFERIFEHAGERLLQAEVIDLRENPLLRRLPRCLHQLNPQVTQEIFFDEHSTWIFPDQSYIRQGTKWLILLMKARKKYSSRFDELNQRLLSHYNLSSKVLDLKNIDLDNETALALPFYHPEWWNVRVIDISKNPRLTQIPSCLGFLSPNITEQILFSEKFLLPSFRPYATAASSVIAYARALLEGSLITLNQIKLFVIGKAAVGKTSLLRALYGEQYNPLVSSTDGIDLGEFMFRGIRFVTWDFGGQKIYRFTHQLFLSDNSLYLLAFKLTDPPRETLRELRFWFNSILSRCQFAKILVVGTHADKFQKAPDLLRHISRTIYQFLVQEFPKGFLHDQIHLFSCLPGAEASVFALRESLLLLAQEANVQAPENFGIAAKFFSKFSVSPPILTLKKAMNDLQVLFQSIKESELDDILEVLNTLGIISLFRYPDSPSSGVVILRPQWIATLLATIVTTKHRFINPETGIVSHTTLTQHIWTDKTLIPPDQHFDLIHLLTELHVLFRFSQRGEYHYFVPCMLWEEAPDVRFFIPSRITELSTLKLRRKFHLESPVPIAVIPPILIDLMDRCDFQTRWQQGCIARVCVPSETDAAKEVWLQLWRPQAMVIELIVWGNSIQLASKCIVDVSQMLVNRITEFYHIPYRVIVACPSCRVSSGYFLYEDLQARIMAQQKDIQCLPSKLHHVRIDSVAPDLLFADIAAAGFLFNFPSLTKIKELGSGAFGLVLLMSYSTTGSSTSSSIGSTYTDDSQLFAVKLLQSSMPSSSLNHQSFSAVEIFQMLKHEVYLMCALDHPNVIKLHGLCLQPFALVMEVVDGGDLYGLLSDPFGLRTSVYTSAQTIKNRVSFFYLECSISHTFAFVFRNRFKLPPTEREKFQQKCAEILKIHLPQISPEVLNDPFKFIDSLYQENIRETPLFELEKEGLTDWYGISETTLSTLLPSLEQLQHSTTALMSKVQQGFDFWYSISSGSTLGDEIWQLREEFVSALNNICSSRCSRDSVSQLSAVEDRIAALSKTHISVLVPITPALRFKLAADIVRGMVHLHELDPSMVHRDLKTPNIFLTRSIVRFPLNDPLAYIEPLAKVGDFGLSVRMSSAGRLQIRDREEDDPMMNLNPTWAAPEILKQEPYSTAVDVYAMGIVLWEILVREHPFAEINDSFSDVLKQKICSGYRPIIPSDMLSDPILREYIALLQSCWASAPIERPSMRFVYDSLQNLAAEQLPTFPNLIPSLPPPLICISSHALHPKYSTLGLDIPPRVERFIPRLSVSSLQNQHFSIKHVDQWQSDSTRSDCSSCGKKFTFLKRRHHCRMCGNLFCDVCSSFTFQKQRLCSVCYLQVATPPLNHKSSPTRLSCNSSDTIDFLLDGVLCRGCSLKFPLSEIDTHACHRISSNSTCQVTDMGLNDSSLDISSSGSSSTCNIPSQVNVAVLLPFRESELIWVGLHNGQCALASRLDSHSDFLEVVVCNPHEAHVLRVNALVYSSSQGGDDGSVWSGSEDGTLQVWEPRSRSVEDVIESSSLKGWLFCLRSKRFSILEQKSDVWAECENGQFRWYRHRYDPHEMGSFHIVSDVSHISLALDGNLTLHLKTSEKFVLRSPQDNKCASGISMSEWFRIINNIVSITQSGSSIMRLASRQLPKQAGILSLESVDHSVWCVGTDFVLSQWTLTSTADNHGLTQHWNLSLLRHISLDPSFLPPRLRTVGGLLRVSQDVLLIAIGNRWIIVHLWNSSVLKDENLPEGIDLDKIIAFTPVRYSGGNTSSPFSAVWTSHFDGSLTLWDLRVSTPDSHVAPKFFRSLNLKELLGDVRVSSLTQINSTQVWMGSSDGRVIAWDISNLQPVPKHLQPLPEGHSLLHKKTVYGLLALPEASTSFDSTIIWSFSRDQSFRRFVLGRSSQTTG